MIGPHGYSRWGGYIRRDWATDNRELFLWQNQLDDASRSFVTGFVTESVAPGTSDRELKAAITDTRAQIKDNTGFLQMIFDLCWDEGMRPANFKDHTSELSAVRYHLEDMRRLAIK